jgi:DNA-binding beta-propeller fold protein YncE
MKHSPLFSALSSCLILAVVEFSCNPPVKGPSVPVLNGPTSGVVGNVLTFKVVSQDEDEDSISYMADWGDTTRAKWTTFAPSGESVSVAHVYHDSSGYSIKAKAKNGKGGESEWSDGHTLRLITAGPGYPDSLLLTFELHRNIQSLALSADGQYLYVAPSDTDLILVFRTVDFGQSASIRVGYEPTKIVAPPDGSYLYVAVSGTNSIAVIRVSDNALVAALASGNIRDMAISQDGRFLYAVTFQHPNLQIWRTSDDSLVKVVLIDSSPTAVAVSASGSAVYAACANGDTLMTIEPTTGLVSAVLDLNGHAFALCASIESGRVYAGDYDRGIRVISADGRTIDTTISVSGRPGELTQTSDGDYLLVGNRDYRGIPVIRTDENAIVGLLSPGGPGVGPIRASPDGSRIYAADQDGRIFVFGRRRERLRFCAWSATDVRVSWNEAEFVPLCSMGGEMLNAAGN